MAAVASITLDMVGRRGSCDRCVSAIDIILGAGPDCFCAPRKARPAPRLDIEVPVRIATVGCDHEDGRNKTRENIDSNPMSWNGNACRA